MHALRVACHLLHVICSLSLKSSGYFHHNHIYAGNAPAGVGGSQTSGLGSTGSTYGNTGSTFGNTGSTATASAEAQAQSGFTSGDSTAAAQAIAQSGSSQDVANALAQAYSQGVVHSLAAISSQLLR